MVEHDLAKVGVAGSSPVSRSNKKGCQYSLLLFEAVSIKIFCYKFVALNHFARMVGASVKKTPGGCF